MRLLLASTNRHKHAELAHLLGPLGVEVVLPDDVGGIPEVEEDGATFDANAAKKAVSAANATGCWSLADDSGLEVDALDGAPGIRSARYAGEPSDDARNNARLLRELAGVPEERRGARFACALALADPEGNVVATLESHANGRILLEPRGTGGFGYDPLFLFVEPDQPPATAGRTFAELSEDEKSVVSHRGRALRELAERLPEILGRTPAER